jgi:hypothetical protein
VNSYSVMYVTGETTEVDADFYQADGSDLVFYLGPRETLRASSADVAGVTKSSTRPEAETTIASQILL